MKLLEVSMRIFSIKADSVQFDQCKLLSGRYKNQTCDMQNFKTLACLRSLNPGIFLQFLEGALGPFRLGKLKC